MFNPALHAAILNEPLIGLSVVTTLFNAKIYNTTALIIIMTMMMITDFIVVALSVVATLFGALILFGYELVWVRVGLGTSWYWVRVDLGTS